MGLDVGWRTQPSEGSRREQAPHLPWHQDQTLNQLKQARRRRNTKHGHKELGQILVEGGTDTSEDTPATRRLYSGARESIRKTMEGGERGGAAAAGPVGGGWIEMKTLAA